jgi:hypothetical protein
MLKVEAIELNERGETIAMKGRVVRVVDIEDLEDRFLSHQFNGGTLKVMFWAQHYIDYCGG